MNVTVEVKESLVEAAIAEALTGAFKYENGVGRKAIHEQVGLFARLQDFSEIIKRLAPAIAEQVVADELEKALRVIAKRQIKTLKDNGDLGGLFNQEDGQL